jgi:hypothetical protein
MTVAGYAEPEIHSNNPFTSRRQKPPSPAMPGDGVLLKC